MVDAEEKPSEAGAESGVVTQAGVGSDELEWHHPSVSAKRTVDEVHTTLKNMIHRGELAPGDCLPPERVLCEVLQVARSTLREALNALRSDGYIEARRGGGGGTFVTRLDEPYARWLAWIRADVSRLNEIMNLRTAVECELAWLATERHVPDELDRIAATLAVDLTDVGPKEFRDADARFHTAIADAAGSIRLKGLMVEARGELFVPASSALVDLPTMARSHEQHAAIYGAIRAGDPGLAAESMRAHLASTYADVARAIDSLGVH